jgi:catechol 2,3-dioxygenase
MATPSAAVIAPDTTVGTVRLTVSDLTRSRVFYEQALGLRAEERDDGGLDLSARDGAPLLELHGDAAAPHRNPRATGLFHFALLLPNRRELAVALARLAEARWRLNGASDHLVSEALYLSDPDGNGIELYRDRPRSDWEVADGEIRMSTLRLDLDDLVDELADLDAVPALAPDGTRMGHVHLQVSELTDTEAFYSGVLGFEVVVRSYPGALFVSAGGYHHHIGLNTWASAGAGPPAPGSVGLRDFDVVVPSREELDRVRERITAAGLDSFEHGDGSVGVSDPSGNAVRVRVGG